MAIKYITDLNQLTKSAKDIIIQHPMGYSGSVVEGGRSEGKSAFCMHTQRQVFQYYEGITRDDAWEKCLKNIMFTLEEVGAMLDELDKIIVLMGTDKDFDVIRWQKDDNTILCKIWDDAGLHGGKYKIFTETKRAEQLQGDMDVLRIILTGFLVNTPELGNLLKFLREYRDQKIIRIKKYPGCGVHGRKAVVKRWSERKHGRGWYLANAYATRFSNYVDKWVYNEYLKLKIKAIYEKRKKFKAMLKVAEKELPYKDPYEAAGIPKEYKKMIEGDI